MSVLHSQMDSKLAFGLRGPGLNPCWQQKFFSFENVFVKCLWDGVVCFRWILEIRRQDSVLKLIRDCQYSINEREGEGEERERYRNKEIVRNSLVMYKIRKFSREPNTQAWSRFGPSDYVKQIISFCNTLLIQIDGMVEFI
jgi:hypothetical protein